MPAVTHLETPLIFTGPNILKVMGQTKWQTRRPVLWKNSPLIPFMARAWVDPGGTDLFGPGPYLKVPCHHLEDPVGRDFERTLRVHSPYGYPGDRLWVRETIRYSAEHDNFYYAADGKGLGDAAYRKFRKRKSLAAIHMWRWACRTLLVVKKIRIEHVQGITDADIRAEGLACPEHDFAGGFCVAGCAALRKAWVEVWDKINKKRGFGWKENPRVWVIDFKLGE